MKGEENGTYSLVSKGGHRRATIVSLVNIASKTLEEPSENMKAFVSFAAHRLLEREL
jgi:hypothetical protein